MTKIWIYLNGIQQGPYTLDELRRMDIAQSTPVWYEGLPQWSPAHEAEVTAALFSSASADDAGATAVAPHEATAATPRPAVAGNDGISSATVEQLHRKAAETRPEEPPTFIGWSVFLLICCFTPGGLLGIVLSAMSSTAYRNGDYRKAHKMSEYAEWTVIISIVLGLLWMPLTMLLYL